MSDRVSVDPVIVTCAVRYALGRRSYMPGLMRDALIDAWGDLGDQRANIVEMIERHLKPDIFEQTYEPAEPHPVARVELFTDPTGDHRWRAIARNGEIVATSGEGYRNAAHARAMAERILPGVEIRDEETDRD